MIPIHLTKEEARLCRDAAKAFGPTGFPLLSAGPVELSRGDWWELQRWLRWCSTDMEAKRWLEQRKAFWGLAERIEAAIDAVEVVPEPVLPAGKQLVMF